jgi:hypothetical protein
VEFEPDAEAAGMDPARLARIDEHLRQRYIEPAKIAGCQTLVLRHGRVAHYSGMGWADMERKVPVAPDTIWRIYSMTKPVTAVALLTLYERGHFQLTDPVARFIPEWRDLEVAVDAPDGTRTLVEPERPMQIRDLMMHTAGIGYGPDNGPLEMAIPTGERQGVSFRLDRDLVSMVERLAATPLRFHPGAPSTGSWPRRSSNRSAWWTLLSRCRPQRSAGSPPATPAVPASSWCWSTTRSGAATCASRPSWPVAAVWYRPSATTPASAACSWEAGLLMAGGSSAARRSS